MKTPVYQVANMASSDMSFWIKFFKDAGIPAGDAANYAVVFSDNRINRAMLMDLNKEYLNDMGISILGDVISILKHAKTVFNQDVRDRALRDTSIATASPEHRQSPVLKRSTPASRTIAHHIGTERSASPSITPSPKISKSLSARLGNPVSTPEPSPIVVKIGNSQKQKEEVPVPRKRRVFPEHEGPYKITMPQGTTAKTQKILEQQRKKAELQRIQADEEKKQISLHGKTSIFSRLGKEKIKSPTPSTSSSEPTITITGLGTINKQSSADSSVFSRLGGKSTVKRAATSTSNLGDDELDEDDLDLDYQGAQLEYAGVLKGSPSKKSKLSQSKVKTSAKKTQKAAEAKKAVLSNTEGVLSGESKPEGKTIQSRLGPKVGEVSSTTVTSQTKSSSIISLKKQGIQNRLGAKPQSGDFTITVDTTTPANFGTSGVFKRLGKTKTSV